MNGRVGFGYDGFAFHQRVAFQWAWGLVKFNTETTTHEEGWLDERWGWGQRSMLQFCI